MPSQLTFPSTSGFRNALLGRNLSPYTVPGVYTPTSAANIVRETVLRDDVVQDSPDTLITLDPFADLLYPLNPYGPNGGYNKSINVGGLANTKSNLGPYDFTDAKLPQQSLQYELIIPTQNKYSSSIPIQLTTINNIQSVPTFAQYYEPLNFVPSTYTPYQIFLQDNPTGDNGSLSQDSQLAQIGSLKLKTELKARVEREILRNTIGRVNLQNAVSDPVFALQLLQGNAPLIERNWQITRPANFVFRVADFAARLAGFNFPGSVIPGDYFTTDEQNLSSFGQISQAFNGGKDPRGGTLGSLFGNILSQKSPSQLFLDNTGGGQKSQLYFNLRFNRYSPDYNKGVIGEILDGATKIINDILDNPTKGGYYVGSKKSDASRIDGPAGEIPVNPFNQEVQSIVYGPDKLAKDFEGEDLKFKFGLAGRGLYDDGGLDGGLVWTSPKYNNPGYKATIGGDQGSQDPEYNLIKSRLEQDLSQGYDFKESSILDQTQRLLDSTPNGGKRLSHVGNAINQLSKVFNDGYKEITKGSKVISYTNRNGVEVGNEYCRVFTKDTPYYTFADLQKTDGNIRKYTYSVLDSTYNLNIAPLKNPGSTNIIGGKVKKYMFSIENLAWRTSNRAGLTVNDLPDCEKGPNGGRVMWFPPYDLSFSEQTTPHFSDTNFLGRPEPVYTYQNTKRSGNLSWKIVVDHPSILNVIVDKELKNERTVQRVNQIVDSFFAGCKKYDIYELARKYNMLSVNELYDFQTIISNGETTNEDLEELKNDVATQTPTPAPLGGTPTPSLKQYEGYGYYFDNDIPDPNTRNTTSSTDWLSTYNTYVSQSVRDRYTNNSKTTLDKTKVEGFFNNVIISNYNQNLSLIKEIEEIFTNNKKPDGTTNATITINLKGSSSAANTESYNLALSKRRVDAVKKYYSGQTSLSKYMTGEKPNLIITSSSAGETLKGLTPKMTNGSSKSYDCSKDIKNDKGVVTNVSQIYTTDAMACRTVIIAEISVSIDNKGDTTTVDNTNNNTTPPIQGVKPKAPTPPTITTTQKIKDGISKKILRKLLSECDYFELVKESNPMFYDTIKEQIKYFSPAFHSITPEGLNSRLTFLQQCTRPGDTIPVIGNDGKPIYNNAVNTSFGAPPVLVLRIGDFYNTKIIPTSLQISYEPLIFDLNPEGIGVQPMIAKITMAFNFVGGSGLKEPIDTLQNALSFNYYANTEMYDERAEFTDDSFKKIDEELVRAILDSPPTVNDKVDNNIPNEGGDTIGVIINKNTNNEGATSGTTSGATSGTTSFTKIMDSLHSTGQDYMTSVVNKTEQVITDYNKPMLDLLFSERDYSKGNTREFDPAAKELLIVGKPQGIEDRLKSLFDLVIDDIDSVNDKNDSGFHFIRQLYEQRYKKNTIKIVKTNLINEVKKVQSSISSSLTSVVQELTTNQQNLTKIFAKLDNVDTKTDGFIKTDQSVTAYNLTATTEVQTGSGQLNTYDELVFDYNSAVDLLSSFYDEFKLAGFIGNKFDPENITLKNNRGFDAACCGDAEKSFYTAMSKVLINANTYSSFKSAVITKDIEGETAGGATLLNYFTTMFDIRRDDYISEHDAEVLDFNNFKKGGKYSKFIKWEPFSLGKVRKFEFSDYVESTPTQTERFQNLYKNGNSNEDKATFNGKNKFN
jgi:hypothetical protein